jgi:hypothetical protein
MIASSSVELIPEAALAIPAWIIRTEVVSISDVYGLKSTPVYAWIGR